MSKVLNLLAVAISLLAISASTAGTVFASFDFNGTTLPDFPDTSPSLQCRRTVYTGSDNKIYISWIDTTPDNTSRDQCSDGYFSSSFFLPKLSGDLLIPAPYQASIKHRWYNGSTWVYTEFWPEVTVNGSIPVANVLMTDHSIVIGTYNISPNWGAMPTPTPEAVTMTSELSGFQTGATNALATVVPVGLGVTITTGIGFYLFKAFRAFIG